jgi:hypothetical protein
MDRAVLEKVIIIQLMKKFSALLRNLVSITVFTRPRHWTLPWARLHPVRAFPPYFCKIYLNVIVPSVPMFSTWSVPYRFSGQNFVCISHLSHACFMSHQAHHPWFVHFTLIIFGECEVWNLSLFSFLQAPVISMSVRNIPPYIHKK